MNYKQEVIAHELVGILALRTPHATAYALDSGGEPVVTIGNVTAGEVSAASLRIYDQRGNVDAGWDALPGFPLTNTQPVYTTGVAQILVESQGIAATSAAARATGTFAFTLGAALSVITIAGITLTEGTDWAKGANDDAAALALKNAINAQPTLALLVVATNTNSLNLGVTPSYVTITALAAGSFFNTIDISSSSGTIVASGATMAGGSAGTASYLDSLTLTTLIAECGQRGLKVELYAVDDGLTPDFANFGTAVLIGAFQSNWYWPLSSLV
jgi:hypothetical protein